MYNVLKNALRVAIYIRVSTKLQEDKYSLSAQTHELTQYANSMNWEIVYTFKDVDSGTKINKGGLDSLLDAVEDGKVDVVLCIEQDRLSRLDTLNWEYLKDVLRDNEVKIAEPGNIVDLSNEDDEFFADFKNLYAQRTRRDYLRKTARGKRQATREGKVSGRQPSEYHFNKLTKEVTVNEERSWIIPYLDKALLIEKKSVRLIAKELSVLIKTPTGKDWHTKQLYDRYKNPAYHGDLVRNYNNGETIITPDAYPKLRTRETFEEIQELLKSRTSKKPAEPHFLRGVKITCACCGMAIGTKKRYFYNDNMELRYPYFALFHTVQKTHDECKAKPYVHDKRIRHSLVVAVKNILMDRENAKTYIDTDFDQSELDRLEKEIKVMERRMRSLGEESDRLLDLYLDGKWKREKLDERKKKLDEQTLSLSEMLDERKRKYELVKSNQINYNTVSDFLSVASRFDTLLDVEEQQSLIGGLFPTATLDDENNTLTLHARLPQNVTVDINVKIETTEEVAEREQTEVAEARYKKAQNHLNKNKGMSTDKLAREVNISVATLWRDQTRFGRFKHLAKNARELRPERIEILKREISEDPKISVRALHIITGINRPAITEIIKTEGLRA